MKRTNKTKALLLSLSLLLQTGTTLGVKAEAVQSLSATMSLYGARGQLIYDIGGETDMSGTIKLSEALTQKADAYISIYDSANNLVKVEKASAEAGASSIDFAIASDGEEDRVLSAFVWNENQVPVTPKINIYNVRISGLENYMGDFTAVYGGAAESVSYNWIHSLDNGATWGNTGAKGQVLKITDDQHASHILGLEVTADGVKYTAEPLDKFPSYWNWTRKDKQDLTGAAVISPEEYVFSVDGVEFVLLDITKKDSARYMLISKNTMGDATLYNPYGSWSAATGSAFTEDDPADEGYGRYTKSSFASFFPMYKYLNDETEETGFKAKYIPKAMWEYIDDLVYQTTNDNTWMQGYDIRTNWFGGIALAKIEEVMEYKDRIGLSNDGKDWWTNSLIYGTGYDASAVHYIAGSDASLMYTSRLSAPNQSGRHLRPLFYVDESFFKNVKIDLTTAGDEIKKEIRKAYSYDELTTLYTTDELDLYYGIEGMSISNAAISGDLEMGAVLAATADYELVADEEVTYSWYVSETEDGTYTKFYEGVDYAIDDVIAGKYIRIKASILNGDSTESEVLYVSVFDESFEGTISKLEARGILIANNTLTVGYETENGVTDEDIWIYKWYEADSADGTYTLVGKESTYKTSNTSGKYYKVSVVLKNGNSYESEPVLVSYISSYMYDTVNHKAQLEAMNVKNNGDYIFTVEENGKAYNYLLLDTVDTADKARFAVMAVETYGKDYAFKNLNDDGFKALLPAVIRDNIDYTVWHETSANAWVTGHFGLYGIGVPTVRVLLNYKDIIGVESYNINDETKTPVVFGTQTGSRETGGGGYTVELGTNSEGIVEVGSKCDGYGNANKSEVRPFFYLDKDFFTEAKIDFKKMGSEVVGMIKENYTVADMVAAGYTEDDVNIYFGNVADMSVDSVEIYGDMTLGSQLQALVSSEYSDYITCKWLISDTADGTYSEIARGENYTLTMDCNEKYLKLAAVLPNGTSAETTPVLVSLLNEEFTGTLTDLTARGIMSAGNTLSLAYVSDTVTDENIIQYQWYKSDSADGTYSLVGTSATVTTEITTSAKYYKAEIMLENGVCYESEPVLIAARNNFAYNNNTHHNELLAMNVDNNEEYLFTVEENGKAYDFLLLDVIPESDNARYKVFAVQTYGKDYAIKNLNSDGFKALLPEVITKHVDYTAYHEGSTNMYGIYGRGHYGIGAVSVAELLKYKDIIGMGAYNIDDENQENGYVRFATNTNSHRSDSAGYVVSIRAAAANDVRVYDRGYMCDEHLNENAAAVCANCIRCDAFDYANDTEIRPFFYLSKDFFNEESVVWASDTIDKMISDT